MRSTAVLGLDLTSCTSLLRTLLAGLALIALTSCGGGGGDSGSASALDPLWISNLTYTPTAAYVDSGGGQVNVTGSVSFSSASGGVASVTIEIRDSVGTIVSTSKTPVAGGGVMYGSVQGTVVASTAVIGDYSVHVTLTDAAGRESNTLSGSFRIAENAWVAKAPMPRARLGFAVAKSSGRVYVLGGSWLGPGGYATDVDIYDPTTDAWTPGVPVPSARTNPAAVALNNVIYLIGGYKINASNTMQALATVEAFDTSTMTWSTKASMPTPRYGAAAAPVNGQICVFGGGNETTYLATTECYDPVLDTWTSKAPMPVATNDLGADILGSSVYVAYITLLRFDVATDSWANVPTPPPYASTAVVAASSLLYTISGLMQVYDPSNDTWQQKTPMPVSLTQNHGEVSIDGTIYVFTPYDTYQYIPGNDIY